MNRVNPAGIGFGVCVLIAGYCFGGHIGLGIGAVIIALIQLL
jgi:hypothetical protein